MAELKGGTTIAGFPATHTGNIMAHLGIVTPLTEAKIAEWNSKANGVHTHKVSDIIGLTDGSTGIYIDSLEVGNVAVFADDILSDGSYTVRDSAGAHFLVINRDGALHYKGEDTDHRYATSGDMDILSADTFDAIDAMENVIADHSFSVASDLVLGHVKVGNNLTIDADGKLHASGGTIPDASTTVKGIVQLNNTFTSTSTTEAATANAVKLVNDKIVTATTARAGIVQLNATVTSTSITEAATASAAKAAFDLANNANSAASLGSQAYTKLFTRNIAIATNAVVGSDSVAIGSYSTANLSDSVAIGYSAKATGNYTMALGAYSNASMYNDAYIGVSSGSTGAWHVRIPGNFSVGGSKSFQIEHPKPEKRDTHLIRHGAVESPSTGDTLYRYSIKIQGNIAKVMLFGENKEVELQVTENDGIYSITIPLPDYFIHLNINEQVFINGDKHFGLGFGEINREEETLNLTLNSLKDYSVMVLGTRNDEGVKDWHIDGVEREVGVSWEGETYNLSDEEILVFDEFINEEEVI